jgi:hypothetical protein
MERMNEGRLIQIYQPWELRKATPEEMEEQMERIKEGVKTDLKAQMILRKKEDVINRLLKPSQ